MQAGSSHTRKAQRLLSLIALTVAALGVCSCELEQPKEEPADLEGPIARRFLPFDPVWRPLSEIPAEPPVSPGMVIWEVSQFSENSEVSEEQRQAANDLIEQSHEAALRNGWLDFEKALRDGYTGLFSDKMHFAKWEFLTDDAVLDPNRPEFLMYVATPEGMQLTGFMFYAKDLEAHGPQIGGPLTLWHYHKWAVPLCLRDNILGIGTVTQSGRCLTGNPSHRSPEMLHVWLLDRSDGPFTSSMYINPESLHSMLAKRKEVRGEPW